MATVARYQRQVFYGTAGTTAATQILCLIEAEVNKSKTYDPTTVRGDGTTIPIQTEQAVERICAISFKIRNETTGDNATTVTSLLAAATHSSNPTIALKVVSYSGGATEFDGDVTLDVADPDSRELSFTARPFKNRTPSF